MCARTAGVRGACSPLAPPLPQKPFLTRKFEKWVVQPYSDKYERLGYFACEYTGVGGGVC